MIELITVYQQPLGPNPKPIKLSKDKKCSMNGADISSKIIKTTSTHSVSSFASEGRGHPSEQIVHSDCEWFEQLEPSL